METGELAKQGKSEVGSPWIWPASDDPLGQLARLVFQAETRGDLDSFMEQINGYISAQPIRLESGKALRFVCEASAESHGGRSAIAYETGVYETGLVPFRVIGEGAWHDAFNALQWVLFPRSKARLNALQLAGIAAQMAVVEHSGKRSELRDVVTLLDEGGGLWLGETHWHLLEQRHWHSLFVEHRQALIKNNQLRLFGHGLMQKMRRPYRSITAWVLPLPVCVQADPAQVDTALYNYLCTVPLLPRPWQALPVLGWPGWDPANQQPEFYADARVFRPL